MRQLKAFPTGTPPQNSAFSLENAHLESQRRYSQYERGLAEACRLFALEGQHVPQIRDGQKSRFPDLGETQQLEILANLNAHNQLLSASLTEVTRSARQPVHSLSWAALKVLGLRPPNDAFNLILDTHIVEIYSPNFTQIFRSLNFFKFVSYSLDELMTYHFSELYMRSGKTTEEMVAHTEVVKNDLQPTTYVRPFTRCTLKEVFGPGGMCVDSDSVMGASLFDHSGKFAGYLSAIEVYHSWTDPSPGPIQ